MSRSVSKTLTFTLVVGLLTISEYSFAHQGDLSSHSFLGGLAHPLLGLDHLLAMIAIGLWAAKRGGKALIMIPASFVTLMALGGVLAIQGVYFPLIEQGIAVSLVVFGLAICMSLQLHTSFCCLIASMFAVFHGHAHGSEFHGLTNIWAYFAGFSLMTIVLHATGIFAGKYLSTLNSLRRPSWAWAGGFTSLYGIYMLISTSL